MSTHIRMPRYLFIILCFVFVLFILFFAGLLLLYVIVPAIVRSTIAKAQLSFHSLSIEEIQNDRFRLRAQLELSRTGSIPATILAPLVIYVDNLGVITNNQSISIKGDSSSPTIVPIDSPFVISDLQAFHNFSRSLIFQEKVLWNLKAKATIRPLFRFMLSYSDIPFEKQVVLDALHGLSNVSINSISLNRSDEQHIFVDLIIQIVNPSIISVDLGELFFSLQYENWSIGHVQSVSENLTLHPGENKIPFVGELKSDSLESFTALSVVIQNFLTNQISSVEVLAGTNATSYPLLAVGMMGLSINVEMPPFHHYLIDSLIFESMSLIPSSTEKCVELSASIVIRINSPLGEKSPLDIKTMDLSSSLLYNGESVGILNVSGSSVEKLNATTFRSQFQNRLLVLSETGATYEKFARDFLRANETNPIDFRIIGFATIAGSFALGPLNIDGILLSNDVSLVGLDGLSKVQVDGISIDGEEERTLKLSINATIENPGVTDVQLEDFTFHLAEAGSNTLLGEIPIDILAVHPGINQVELHGFLAPTKPSDLPAFARFFSAYLNGQTQSVKLYHDQTSSPNATAMDLTVSGLAMRANLNGIDGNLIRGVEVLDFGIDFDPMNVSKVFVTGRFKVVFQLPANVHMNFKALTSSINYRIRLMDGTNIGLMILEDMPVEHNQITNEIFMNFTGQELHILNDRGFEQFAANLVLTNSVSFMIEGLIAAEAQTRIGNLSLSEIPLNETIHLVGYDQFGNGLLTIDQIDILGSMSSQQLILRVKTEISNPSVVNILNGGRLSLDLCDTLKNISLGLVNIDPFYLEPQGNQTIVEAEGIFTMNELNKDVAEEFISRMVSGLNNQVELKGILPDNSTGTSIPLLQTAIAGLRIQTDVPGLHGNKTLVQEIILKKLTAAQIAGIPLGLVKTLQARIRLVNPFNTSLLLRRIDVRADFAENVDKEKQVGIVEDSTPISVRPYENLITSYLTVKLTAEFPTMVSLVVPLFAGNARLSLSGSIDVTLGNDFELNQLQLTVLNVTTIQD